MPVSVAKGRERPLHRVPTDTGQNMVIFENIRQIIEIDEIVVDNRVVESKRDGCQQEAEDNDALLETGRHFDRLSIAAIDSSDRAQRILWPQLCSLKNIAGSCPEAIPCCLG